MMIYYKQPYDHMYNVRSAPAPAHLQPTKTYEKRKEEEKKAVGALISPSDLCLHHHARYISKISYTHYTRIRGPTQKE